jgi:hypothetical protein
LATWGVDEIFAKELDFNWIKIFVMADNNIKSMSLER